MRKATLPIAAAVGGAVLPAAIFALIVGGGLGSSGWGIPMATDIAFALGVLALLGSRVPVGLRIFLTALAIVDDLLAVLVIAVFYTDDLHVDMLVRGGRRVRGAAAGEPRRACAIPIVYAALGILLWIFVLKSGVHATIAGVLLAVTIPARVRIDPADFVARARAIVDRFERTVIHDPHVGVEDDHEDLWELETVTEQAQAPMLRLEHTLHPWVAFLIVPLFALANAGVTITPRACCASRPTRSSWASSWASWWASRSASPPPPGSSSAPAAPRCRTGVTWRHIYGVGWLGGIGFTMSLFIAELALDGPGSCRWPRWASSARR